MSTTSQSLINNYAWQPDISGEQLKMKLADAVIISEELIQHIATYHSLLTTNPSYFDSLVKDQVKYEFYRSTLTEAGIELDHDLLIMLITIYGANIMLFNAANNSYFDIRLVDTNRYITLLFDTVHESVAENAEHSFFSLLHNKWVILATVDISLIPPNTIYDGKAADVIPMTMNNYMTAFPLHIMYITCHFATQGKEYSIIQYQFQPRYNWNRLFSRVLDTLLTRELYPLALRDTCIERAGYTFNDRTTVCPQNRQLVNYSAVKKEGADKVKKICTVKNVAGYKVLNGTQHDLYFSNAPIGLQRSIPFKLNHELNNINQSFILLQRTYLTLGDDVMIKGCISYFGRFETFGCAKCLQVIAVFNTSEYSHQDTAIYGIINVHEDLASDDITFSVYRFNGPDVGGAVAELMRSLKTTELLRSLAMQILSVQQLIKLSNISCLNHLNANNTHSQWCFKLCTRKLTECLFDRFTVTSEMAIINSLVRVYATGYVRNALTSRYNVNEIDKLDHSIGCISYDIKCTAQTDEILYYGDYVKLPCGFITPSTNPTLHRHRCVIQAKKRDGDSVIDNPFCTQCLARHNTYYEATLCRLSCQNNLFTARFESISYEAIPKDGIIKRKRVNATPNLDKVIQHLNTNTADFIFQLNKLPEQVIYEMFKTKLITIDMFMAIYESEGKCIHYKTVVHDLYKFNDFRSTIGQSIHQGVPKYTAIKVLLFPHQTTIKDLYDYGVFTYRIDFDQLTLLLDLHDVDLRTLVLSPEGLDEIFTHGYVTRKTIEAFVHTYLSKNSHLDTGKKYITYLTAEKTIPYPPTYNLFTAVVNAIQQRLLNLLNLSFVNIRLSHFSSEVCDSYISIFDPSAKILTPTKSEKNQRRNNSHSIMIVVPHSTLSSHEFQTRFVSCPYVQFITTIHDAPTGHITEGQKFWFQF